MGKKKTYKKSEYLVSGIIDSIKKNKGKEVVSIDLRKIEKSICDFFIICHGTSSTHITSIAQNIKKEITKELKEKPWHIEGEDNKEWILLDYFNVVVHIFNKDKRDFYNLENLWADAKIDYIEQLA
jgi:ribosome-associated protein|tara:strand:+ start:1476 stop:1853 length:378 start_codon:yes stop_codon:yes gene_type:complete